MYTILGTCDNVTDCECCGRSNLKRTVALSNEGATVYYGTQCAANATKRSKAWVKKSRKVLLCCEECGHTGAHRTNGRFLCYPCTDSHRRNLLGE